MKNVIFFFSGTGNSLRVARIIAQKIGNVNLIPMKAQPLKIDLSTAETVGFVCPVYEWDIPKPVKNFIENLNIPTNAYIYAVVTYVAIHGRCFETVNKILRQKGMRLLYGRAIKSVGSECIAYEPFPSPKRKVPKTDKVARKVGLEISNRKIRRFPKMSPVARMLYKPLMQPFINVQHEFDKGFYTNDKCISCHLCQRICSLNNITFDNNRPVWNNKCIGCNACVVYCPTKAIQYNTPQAYRELNNIITRRLGLPDKRTRYHNPHITANDLIIIQEYIE